MSELEIPERALEEAWSMEVVAGLRAAAPIVVAAKLRALELKLACREDRALVLAEADALDPPAVGA